MKIENSSIMKAILLTIISAAIILMIGCKNKSDLGDSNSESVNASSTSSTYTDENTKMTNIKLTSQSTMAGVQSNVAGSKKYELNFDVQVSSKIKFDALLVDSISLPFSTFIINGEKQSSFTLDKSISLGRLTAYRQLYSTNYEGPHVSKEKTYELSGLQLENKAVLAYSIESKPYYIELGEIKTLQSVYAP